MFKCLLSITSVKLSYHTFILYLDFSGGIINFFATLSGTCVFFYKIYSIQINSIIANVFHNLQILHLTDKNNIHPGANFGINNPFKGR